MATELEGNSELFKVRPELYKVFQGMPNDEGHAMRVIDEYLNVRLDPRNASDFATLYPDYASWLNESKF